LSESFAINHILNEYPEQSDDPKDVLTDGLPALSPLLLSLYQELVLDNPQAGIWRNEIARSDFYGAQIEKISNLLKELIRQTDTRLVIETSADEKQKPIEFTKIVRDPIGKYEQVDSLNPGSSYPIMDVEGEAVRIPEGWLHYFGVGQVLHQDGRLNFVKLARN
jgi:hypothetical protein